MFRKALIAIAAAGALGGAALAPTSASAHWNGGHGGWHGHFWGPIGLYAGPAYDSCVRRQWVDTPYGPRLRWVNVCY